MDEESRVSLLNEGLGLQDCETLKHLFAVYNVGVNGVRDWGGGRCRDL